MSDEKGRVIAAFLRYFDGDPERAVAAIRQYTTRNSDAQTKTAVPLGSEIISAKDVVKTYKVGRQKIEVLRGVSLSVRQREFVALTGASGSGKSTLLQLIGGLDKPTSGLITVNGQALSALSDRKLSQFRGRTIGFVFQSFYLQPFLNLATNLEIPGMFARTNPRERRQHAVELAKMVNVAERMKHLPKELSGGQMQRAAIARALLNQPKVLLADEPTGNLDSVNSQRVIDIFEQIRRQLGTTILIVTHDHDIARQTDREITLHDGRVL